MNSSKKSFLIIQTAFIGDAILTLPLAEVVRKNVPSATIDVVAIPRTADVFKGHSAIDTVYAFDKKGKDAGVRGFFRFRRQLHEKQYDIALVPHRSLRSAFLARSLNIPMRIGFDRSAGKMFFTHLVAYQPQLHEIDRNLSLLEPLNISIPTNMLPHIEPAPEEREAIDLFLRLNGVQTSTPCVAIAPGSIWATKRWLPERYTQLAQHLAQKYVVFLLGGREDWELCESIKLHSVKIINCAGELTLRQSAEVLRRCKVLISNDSAPMHIAVAVGTPVVAIFGATIPEFGFAPRGPHDVVVEVKNLPCRPCGIHGGMKCPIKTFDCMKGIHVSQVLQHVEAILSLSERKGQHYDSPIPQ